MTEPRISLDPEEQRLSAAKLVLGAEITPLADRINLLPNELSHAKSFEQTQSIVTSYGLALWNDGISAIKHHKNFDDRPLYWGRLGGQIAIKQQFFSFAMSLTQRKNLLQLWQDSSRGLTSINYKNDPEVHRIFITGFDPFLLDRNIKQSNPSGIAALLLDGHTFEFKGKMVQIEAVMIPVRFDDFDQGLIERILEPLIDQQSNIDLIVTISMGRSDFDLERFPGKRRSATISGNRNVITGASPTNPLVGLLNSQPHPGAEFVEFSLPVHLMQQASGPYEIHDNHQVTTLAKGQISPITLAELDNEISVQGSGGSYLSNEISYRSIALRDQLASDIAIGHIHTPSINTFDPIVIEQIINQLTDILKHASISFE